jgi:hypothetical protein
MAQQPRLRLTNRYRIKQRGQRPVAVTLIEIQNKMTLPDQSALESWLAVLPGN